MKAFATGGLIQDRQSTNCNRKDRHPQPIGLASFQWAFGFVSSSLAPIAFSANGAGNLDCVMRGPDQGQQHERRDKDRRCELGVGHWLAPVGGMPMNKPYLRISQCSSGQSHFFEIISRLSLERLQMKNQFKWMPVYWNDLEIDTVQLSPLEFGVYMLLTSYYWRSGGPIPDSDAVLSRAARMTVTEWNDVKANVLRMFEFDDGFWRSSLIDEKFTDCRRTSEQNRDSANKGWARRRGAVVQLVGKER